MLYLAANNRIQIFVLYQERPKEKLQLKIVMHNCTCLVTFEMSTFVIQVASALEEMSR